MVPLVAPLGTVATSCVVDADVTLAVVPWNFTVLFAAVALKFAPVIVTDVPTGPLLGLNPEIVGGPTTVKLLPLVAVSPATVTLIVPVVAPLGTVATRLVVVAEVTVAVVPLNLTVLLAAVELKFVPEIVTEEPTAPLVGLKLEIVGGTVTVNVPLLVPVRPPTVTEIVPVVAPLGTGTTN